jgi:hypothetical protein
MGVAQFPNLPKTPTVPKKDTKTSKPSTLEIRPSVTASTEVLLLNSISPDSAPPGGHGQVVLTGKDFKGGMGVGFTCAGASFDSESVKVDSPTKVEVQISVPVTAQEGPCYVGNAPDNKLFRISISANMPIALPSLLLGEGDMQYFALMMKFQQAVMASHGNPGNSGRIELASGSIKYVQGEKTVFTESISGVKSMAEMKQGGQPFPIFRIVFNDGKIYNFMEQGKDEHAEFALLQKKLGK